MRLAIRLTPTRGGGSMTLAIGWLHDGGETVGTWLHDAGDWQQLERLCRYITRPPVSHVKWTPKFGPEVKVV